MLAWVLVVPGLVWAALRVSGWSPGPVAVLVPFTPYAAIGSLIVLVVVVVLRRWRAAVVAGVATAVLAGCVIGRVVPDRDRGPREGVALTVLSANMLIGRADPEAIVRRVRDEDVGVLALQEFTAAGQAALAKAGLGRLLPYSSIAPQRPQDPYGTTGSALYSRFPLTGAGFRLNYGGFQQAYGTVSVPGAKPVTVESVHPAAPHKLDVLGDWRRDLKDQPGPGRILAGDFNATLDHKELRDVLGRGYRDAAATVGKGWVPSWGPYADRPIPPITIDHVLVDRTIGIGRFAAYDLPGSDHRMVLAAVVLPAGQAGSIQMLR
ncbi:endonuclease/exonuclease/phosphatase family protein [Paractinoplanes atraurantiacus]|uniref:endonuclease/exonuclease/phosphatase family protein n=1 Tax=Paractinoplanes atraurantiacus TaxID=1036182 RepID=UPI000BE2B29E|nr:endonuclease/exonuclease/phosphatase family protein [Actinoplanes atraurantiacus]